MSTGFQTEAARPKRARDEDAPSQQPMRPSGIRNAPSTDQKKVRRAMNRGIKPKTASEESPMNDHDREVQILRAMAVASLPDQHRLAAELERLRASRTASLRESRSIDLSSTVVQAHLTPVPVHERHTAATDWIGMDTPLETDPTLAMRTEAAVWFNKVSDEVKADREEFTIQAQGMARRLASRHGEQARVAERAFLDAVAHMLRGTKTAVGEADEDQSGNAESAVTDYDLIPADDTFAFEEGWAQAGTGDPGVHPDLPGAGDQATAAKTAGDFDEADGPLYWSGPNNLGIPWTRPQFSADDLEKQRLFPNGIPLRGDLTPEQEAWLKRRGSRTTAQSAPWLPRPGERTKTPMGEGTVVEHAYGGTFIVEIDGKNIEVQRENMKRASRVPSGDSKQSSHRVAAEGRPLHEIADEIKREWPNVYFGAVPYLEAMRYMATVDDYFGMDDGRSVVTYFLSNATTWRGEAAKRIKGELKALLGRSAAKTAIRVSVADPDDPRGVPIYEGDVDEAPKYLVDGTYEATDEDGEFLDLVISGGTARTEYLPTSWGDNPYFRSMTSSRKTAISLTNIGIEGENGVGTDPQGNRVRFRLSPKDKADLQAILYSDMAINFTGVDVEESEIIREGSKVAEQTSRSMTSSKTAKVDLWSLKEGDKVLFVRDGRATEMTVRREIEQVGAPEHRTVSLTLGPGRWSTEVSQAGIDMGLYDVQPVGTTAKVAEQTSPDPDSQSGDAESGLEPVEVGDNNDSAFPVEIETNTPGTGAADVAAVPTPGGEAGYPQPTATRKRAEWNGRASLTAFQGDLNALRDAVKSSKTVSDAIYNTQPLWSTDSVDREIAFQFISSAFGVNYDVVFDTWMYDPRFSGGNAYRSASRAQSANPRLDAFRARIAANLRRQASVDPTSRYVMNNVD